MFSIESLGSFLMGLVSALPLSIIPANNQLPAGNRIAASNVRIVYGSAPRNLEEGTFSENLGIGPKLKEIVICKNDDTSEVIPV